MIRNKLLTNKLLTIIFIVNILLFILLGFNKIDNYFSVNFIVYVSLLFNITLFMFIFLIKSLYKIKFNKRNIIFSVMYLIISKSIFYNNNLILIISSSINMILIALAPLYAPDRKTNKNNEKVG
jgi:hypothetical protein